MSEDMTWTWRHFLYNIKWNRLHFLDPNPLDIWQASDMRQTKLYLKSNISESDNQNQISRTDSTTLQVHCKKFQFLCWFLYVRYLKNFVKWLTVKVCLLNLPRSMWILTRRPAPCAESLNIEVEDMEGFVCGDTRGQEREQSACFQGVDGRSPLVCEAEGRHYVSDSDTKDNQNVK